MDQQKFSATDYVDGKAALPADFDTGYRHHLETAREIVKLRQDAVTGPVKPVVNAG